MLSQGGVHFCSQTLIFRISSLVLLFGLLGFAAGCGGGGGLSGTVQPAPTPATTAMQFKVGDDAYDRLVSVEATLDYAVLMSPGNMVNVLPSSRRLEFCRLAGTSQLIGALQVPQGTYTSTWFELSNLHVTYLDQSGQWQEYRFTDKLTYTMPKGVAVGADSQVVSVDFDLANSVKIDPTNQTPPTISPVFIFSSGGFGGSASADAERRAVENMIGPVKSVSGSSFTMSSDRDDFAVTFKTDKNTEFDSNNLPTLLSLSTLPNMLVKVNGTTQMDGSLMADKVEVLADQNGVEMEGLLYRFSDFGPPVGASMIIIAQDGVGAGLFPYEDYIGKAIRVDTTNATYAVDTDGVDMTRLNFVFDRNAYPASLQTGVRVRVQSNTGFVRGDNATNVIAQKVTLLKQSLTGWVQNYQAGTPAQFDLQLPSDGDYVTLVAGLHPIHVWQQSATELSGVSSINNKDYVRVRGLLFWDHASQTFNLVAQKIEE